MIKDYVDLKRNEKFERKIRIACDFHSAKYEFTRGRILNASKFNVSFINVKVKTDKNVKVKS